MAPTIRPSAGRIAASSGATTPATSRSTGLRTAPASRASRSQQPVHDHVCAGQPLDRQLQLPARLDRQLHDQQGRRRLLLDQRLHGHLRRQRAHRHRLVQGRRRRRLAGLDLSGTTHTNAGDYLADPWTFTDVTGNYNDTSGTVHDKIDKANADCSSISGYRVTYDGNAAHRHRHLQGRRRHDRPGRASTSVGHDPHQRRRLPRRPLDVHRRHRQLQRHLGHRQRQDRQGQRQLLLDQRLHASPTTAARTPPPAPSRASTATTCWPGSTCRGTTHTNAGTYQRRPLDVHRRHRQLQRHHGHRPRQDRQGQRRLLLDQRLHGHLRRQRRTPPPAPCKGVDGDRAGRARHVGHDPHQRRRLPSRPLDVHRRDRQLQRHLGHGQRQDRQGRRRLLLDQRLPVTYDGNAHTATGTCKGVGGSDLRRARPQRHHPHQRRHLQRRPVDASPTYRQLQRHHAAPSTTRSTRPTPTAPRSAATRSPTTATRTPPPARARASTATRSLAWTSRARPTPTPAPTTPTRGRSPT